MSVPAWLSDNTFQACPHRLHGQRVLLAVPKANVASIKMSFAGKFKSKINIARYGVVGRSEWLSN